MRLSSLCIFVGITAQFSPSAHALWPQPRSLKTGSSAIRLSPDFSITTAFSSPQDLESAISRTYSFLRNDKLGRLVVGRGASDTPAVRSAPELKSLTLSLLSDGSGATPESIAKEAQKALPGRDEGYLLTVPAHGTQATLSANTTLGLFRGLTTFTQLWYEYDGDTYTLDTPIEIEDSPAFPYRGFMLDTARNFFSVSDIQRTLDAMSWVKINTFHWHVTDSQSFPIEVPGFLELSQFGAYSNNSRYTVEDVQNIVNYAGERGIDVLMEIDTPGHSSIIAAAHPEHIACFEATPWPTFAGEPPAGQLRLASASTTNFTASLLAAAAGMTPSTLFSTGGDEINTNCYTADAETQAELNATGRTLEQALNVFTQATHGALRALGKSPVVWEEMVLEHNVTLGNDTVVMIWISSQDASAVVAKGFQIVHSPSDYFYLDCGAGAWLGNDIDGVSSCDPFKSWQKAYSFDPFDNLTASQRSLVLGGQQLLWAEQSVPENLDPIVWPRAAASAEVFWTGTGADGAPLNGTAALPRLHDVRFRMAARGVRAIALQPEWCALRPDACDS
ncbi:hypothetical protein M0805_007737 [Coniferiporia weirii]|nr:hypothetical protein M0805_007737 [Coniferiporia weirii]